MFKRKNIEKFKVKTEKSKSRSTKEILVVIK